MRTIKLIGITALFIVLLSLWVFFIAVRPFRITSTITPLDLGMSYHNVSFETEDGVTLRGWFIPNKNKQAPTVILLHGYPADKGDILPSRAFLHKKYNLLFIDFRYLGESGGHYSTIGKDEILDLKAAIQYLKRHDIQEVAVWGLSMGGAVALMTATNTPEIKGIIAESPYARLDWLADNHYPIPGVDYLIGQGLRVWAKLFLGTDINTVKPAESAASLQIPLLILYSKTDKVISYRHAELMQETLADKKNATIMIQEDAPHGALPEDYQVIVSKFLEKVFANNPSSQR